MNRLSGADALNGSSKVCRGGTGDGSALSARICRMFG
jgi:hypothetical protein